VTVRERQPTSLKRFNPTRLDQADDGRIKVAAAAAPADTDRASRRQPTMEEVIVTAQKRAQDIQDVPVSIAVISAADITQRGLVSSEDYLRGVPGANQVDSNFGPAVVIRGLETTTTSQNFASGSTVAMYFGESPVTRSAGITGGSGADIKLVDIERVEVLRGPQGTAFGDSSLGGAVRTIPVAPKLDRFEAKVKAGYSMTSGYGDDNYLYQGIVNIPLVQDKLAIRANAYKFEDSGFYRNVAGSDPVIQAGVTRFRTPASYARNEEGLGGSTFEGGRIAALYQPTNELKFTVTYLKQDTSIDAWAGANRPGYDQAILAVGPEDKVFGHTQGGTDTNIELLNAVAEYDLGWADMLGTYTHIKGGSDYAYPWSVTGANPMTSATRSDHDEDSGELRIVSKFEGPLNFIAGVYAENVDDLWTQTVYWYADLATIPFASSVPYTAPGILNDSRNELGLKQKAAFSEVSWAIVPKLTLTAGVRAYDYERTTLQNEYGALTSPAASNVVRTTARDIDASGTNLRGNLSFKPTDDSLIYAGWSEGFRLGKPQPGLPAGACDVNGDGNIDGTTVPISSTQELQSDSVESYELGGKFTFADRRIAVSAAIFRTDWEDIPVQVRATCAGGTLIGYTANAAKARSEGIEAQVGFQVTDALRVDLGGSYLDAELTEDALGLVPAAHDGDRLPSPKKNANLGVRYEFTLGEYDSYVRTDAIYVDAFNGRLPPAAANTSDEYVKVDLSVGMVFNRANIDLYVRNLTNDDAITFAPTPYPVYRLRPRTIGFQLGYEF
jgi:outer membrane receptor protein involved in Fe transport